MRNSQNTALKKLLNKQFLFMYSSIFLCIMALMLWLFIPYFIQSINPYILLWALLGIAVLAAVPFLYPSFKRKQNKRIWKQLNHHPKMEYSTQLLLKEPSYLNSLEKIQLSKIQVHLNSVLKEIKAPHFLGKAFFCFLVNLVLVGCVIQFQLKDTPIDQPTQINELVNSPQTKLEQIAIPIPRLMSYRVHITPPTYTKLKSSASKKLDVEVPEGSTLKWSLNFDRNAPTPLLEIDGQIIAFNTNDSITYTTNYKPKKSTLYNLQIDTPVKAPVFKNLHRINIIPDKKPLVRITNLENYQQIKESTIQPKSIVYILQDDYGISKAELQLTKSSGDGESVTFKQKNYTLPTINNKTEQFININLLDLKLIRIEAQDNHPSKKQNVFSNTYIIAIEDTTSKKAEFTMTLGMDREPEYFRSQRQIIIDTENLIEQRSKLNDEVFKDESNNIGIDQKILRLRYGKFLGEEFEGQIGVRTTNEAKSYTTEESISQHTENLSQNKSEEHHHHNHDEHCTHDNHHTEEEVSQENAEHQHHENCDHEHEKDHTDKHNHTVEHDHAHDHSNHGHDHAHNHSHGNESENPEEPKNWLAPFQHFHDNAESNTFFESEVKAKLKAALAQMWDAELQLRLAKPNLSLPYQHKALQLIKEVQQAGRVYVERVGLDLPEINVAKKRLTGELDEIIDPKQSYAVEQDQLLDNIYLALQSIDYLKQQKEYPENLMETLSHIKNLLNGLRDKNEPCYVQCVYTINQIPIDQQKLQELQLILNIFLKQNEPVSGKTVQKNSSLENLYWQYVY